MCNVPQCNTAREMPAESLKMQEIAVREIPDSPKSRRTRARILDAAMRLYAEGGYQASGHAQVAEASNLTRGAMLYHFPDRESLMEAVVPHIQTAREHLLQAAVNEAPHGADRADYAIDSYWRLLHKTPFVAFAELERAARTDPVVRKYLAPAQDAFDRAEVGEPPIRTGAGRPEARGCRPGAISPVSCWRVFPAPASPTTATRGPSGC